MSVRFCCGAGMNLVSVVLIVSGAVFPAVVRSEISQLKQVPKSLEELEAIAISGDSSIQAARTGFGVYESRIRQHYGKLLPSVVFETGVSGTDKNTEDRTVSSDVTATLKLPDPMTFLNEGKQAGILGEKARLETEIAQREVLQQIRKQYYQILYQQKKLSLKKDLLQILQRVFEDTRKRYYAGLIHKLDFQKARLSLTQAVSEIENLEAVLKNHLQKLTEMIPGLDARKISFPAHVYFLDAVRLSGLLTEDFFSGFRKEQSPGLKLNELLLKSATLEVEEAGLFYMPAFSFSASRATDGRARGGMTYSAGISWNLFNGGRDYYAYREKVALKEKQGFNNETATRDWLLKFDSLRHSLELSLSELKLQFNVVKTWEEMITLSSGRFSRGLAEYRELSDDLEKFSRQKEDLVDLQFRLWNELIDFSSHCGNSELFRKFVSALSKS